jgi:hypothetical protein
MVNVSFIFCICTNISFNLNDNIKEENETVILKDNLFVHNINLSKSKLIYEHIVC